MVAANALAFVVRDKHPVTPLHTLVIPKRHVADYFSLHQGERNAIEALLHQARTEVLAQDATVAGFNSGINSGDVAGQTIFHCHVHLIPRRSGDVPDRAGGVRHLIPGKGGYR